MEETIPQKNSGCEEARSSCAFFDFSDWSVLAFSGEDCKRFLHNFCTNDIERLKPGEGCESFVANIKGRVVGLVQVFVSENSIELLCEPNANRKLFEHFDKYLITDDVSIEDKAGTLGQLFLAGPQAEESLSSAEILKDPLEKYRHRIVSLDGISIGIRRFDLLQQPGFLCSFEKNKQDDVADRLEQAGFVPGGEDCFEYLRIDAGYPIFGIDMSDENLVQEVGRTSLAVSFSGGCYLGQETIARLDSMGHTNKMLCRLTFAESYSVKQGDRILLNEEETGQIASVSSLDGTQPTVALGYLKQKSTEPGTNVTVVVDSGKHTATVKSILDE